MGMLQAAWVLLLIQLDIAEPQWYAIPAGLYFSVIGYLERRRGRKTFGIVVESFGLAVLLVTTYIQSTDADSGFPYFLLLLGEGFVVGWWGAVQRMRNPFFIGLGSVALNVITQVIILINTYEVQRWIIILGVGLLLVILAVFIERQREKVIAQAREWREALELWE
jgi:hypothetical protein